MERPCIGDMLKQFKSDLETLDSDTDIFCWRSLSLINKSLMN